MRSLFRSRTPDPALTVELDPSIFPKIDGADIAGAFEGNRVAGDFYDVIRVSPERVLFGLLDVAGRREDNRGILTAAQKIFRDLGAELFSRPDINESDAMSQLTHRINRGLIEVSNGVHSCPAFLGCFHEKFGTLCYTNAGHTPGLLHDSTGVSELPSTGLPLGLFSHATSDAPTVGIEKGASLLLVSRGVVECGGHHDESEEEFSLDRVKQILQNAPSSSATATAKDLCVSVLNAIGEFTAHCPPHDDQTALALIRTL